KHPDDDRRIAFAMGDLAPEEEALIRAHTRECDACRTQIARLSMSVDAVRSAPGIQASLAGLVRLLESAASSLDPASRSHGPRWRHLVRIGRRVAAVAVVAAVFFCAGAWYARRSGAISAPGHTGAHGVATAATPLPAPPRLALRSNDGARGDV